LVDPEIGDTGRVRSPIHATTPGPTPAELRAALDEACRWVADYLDSVGDRPVLAQVEPGEIAARLPLAAPAGGEPLSQIMADIDALIMPGITHWNHPAFFAYFGITGSGPGIVGELISAALNVNAMLWRTSPAATELEQRTLSWVLDMLGLPAAWFGQITDSASASTLCALAAAREAAGLDIRRRGMAGRDLPPLRVYTSEEAHSSVEKACIVLGFGQDGVTKIATDGAFRMQADLLSEAIDRDIAAGVLPIAVVASVGTTSTTSVDPVDAVADICARHKLWLHVDAAYGGAAGLLESHRHLLAGCERADSLVFNPHKWLFTQVDCSLLYTSRPEVLRAAFSVVPFYLTSSESEVVNYMDYGVSLGRRFRALKLWLVIRAYGRDGLAELVAGHIDMARRLARLIEDEPGWELMAPVPLSTVCFRAHPSGVDDEAELERLNTDIVERVNASGVAFVSHTKVAGCYAIRVAIGNAASTWQHVEKTWHAVTQR
jgi:aromatic-L-amino-acid/L-tryptophan decarboxylase